MGSEGFGIVSTGPQDDEWRQYDHGVYLLFAKGKRPDRSSIRRFTDRQASTTISYDPADDPPVVVDHLSLIHI